MGGSRSKWCHMVVYLKEHQQSEVNKKFFLDACPRDFGELWFFCLKEKRRKEGGLETSMDQNNECLNTYRKWLEWHDYRQELAIGNHTSHGFKERKVMLPSPAMSVKSKNPDFLWWFVGGCGMFLSERLIGTKTAVISEGCLAQDRLSKVRQCVRESAAFGSALLFAFLCGCGLEACSRSLSYLQTVPLCTSRGGRHIFTYFLSPCECGQARWDS